MINSLAFSQTAKSSSVYDGYTLFAPLGSTTTYLIDIDGNVSKTWESSYLPGNSAYILDDHTLLRTTHPDTASFSEGGSGGGVEQYDWDGNLTWSYTYSSDTYCSHHDVEQLPNGNVLMIAWELKSEAEAIAAGRNPSLISAGSLWPDHIIEVQPDGTDGGTIVWEWHAWDHLVQDYDSTKDNYGVVADHPELIDLNYVEGNGVADWLHTNSVAYSEELDQIVLSIHNFSEVWIIDHSTTTAEAANHSDGRYGKGGDLLYRWGNPQTYGAGTSDDQKLFEQHDAYWIPTGYPGAGDILIFNNGLKRPDGEYSSVEQITTPVDSSGNYSLTSGSAYGPESTTWTYKCDFYAWFISGAQRLPNGNTLICDGPDGYFVEIDSDGNTLWEYTNPYSDESLGAQVFRCYRYSAEYLGLSDDSDTDSSLTYPIVDTNQGKCYNNTTEITAPAKGEDFYGQDAQFDGNQPSYTKSADGLTIYDNNTGLTWTQSADLNGDGTINYDDKLTFAEAQAYPDTLNAAKYGGYDDWRLPTIKELFSLMEFSGVDPSRYSGSDTSWMTPFIDTDYFDFGYGDRSADERFIDAQFASSTESVSPIIEGRDGMFGLNLADGRIKGYPTDTVGISNSQKKFYVYFVRGNTSYGNNSFTDNGDGTISDKATGLMWSQDDCGNQGDGGPSSGLNWQEAMAWVQTKNAENYLGHSDWRLPNGKELHSIVDYSRSPDTTNSAAIDPIFNCTSIINEEGESDYPYFWCGTTHKEYVSEQDTSSGHYAVYIPFGRGLGYFNGSWQDVHGAGCQRAEVKNGDPADYPEGYGPQGDAVRIYNYVRLVRDDDSSSGGTDTNNYLVYKVTEKITSYGSGDKTTTCKKGMMVLDPSTSIYKVLFYWKDADGNYWYQQEDWASASMAWFTTEKSASKDYRIFSTLASGTGSFDLRYLYGTDTTYTVNDTTINSGSSFKGYRFNMESNSDSSSSFEESSKLTVKYSKSDTEDAIEAGTSADNLMTAWIAALDSKYQEYTDSSTSSSSVKTADTDYVLVYKWSQRVSIKGNDDGIHKSEKGYAVLSTANNRMTILPTWSESGTKWFKINEISTGNVLAYDVNYDTSRGYLRQVIGWVESTATDSALSDVEMKYMAGKIKDGYQVGDSSETAAIATSLRGKVVYISNSTTDSATSTYGTTKLTLDKSLTQDANQNDLSHDDVVTNLTELLSEKYTQETD